MVARCASTRPRSAISAAAAVVVVAAATVAAVAVAAAAMAAVAVVEAAVAAGERHHTAPRATNNGSGVGAPDAMASEFAALGLVAPLLRGLLDAGYDTP